MSETEFDRVTRAWLDAKPDRMSDRALQTALDTIHVTRQRRPVWTARRFPSMHSPFRLAIAVGAIVLAVALGLQFLPTGGTGGPAPSPSPSPSPSSSRSPSPTATAAPIPLGLNGAPDSALALTPGATYLTPDPFPLRVTFTAPTGWSGKVGGPNAVWLGPFGGDDIVSFQRVQTVYADPCHPRLGPVDPPVGPTVDDLVEALSHRPGVTASAATEVAISGYRGKQLTLTASGDATSCTDRQFLLWTLPLGADVAMAPASQERITVLDVGGERLVIVAYSPRGQSASDLAATRTILDSIAIRAAD